MNDIRENVFCLFKTKIHPVLNLHANIQKYENFNY